MLSLWAWGWWSLVFPSPPAVLRGGVCSFPVSRKTELLGRLLSLPQAWALPGRAKVTLRLNSPVEVLDIVGVSSRGPSGCTPKL